MIETPQAQFGIYPLIIETAYPGLSICARYCVLLLLFLFSPQSADLIVLAAPHAVGTMPTICTVPPRPPVDAALLLHVRLRTTDMYRLSCLRMIIAKRQSGQTSGSDDTGDTHDTLLHDTDDHPTS